MMFSASLPSHLFQGDNHVYGWTIFPLHNAPNHALNIAANHAGQY